MANRLDPTTYQELDRARWYPVIRDALAIKAACIVAADFWFACPREEAAEAAAQLLTDEVQALVATLVKGGMEWGRQSCVIDIEPVFDVTVSSGQGEGGNPDRKYPFLWTYRFRAFDPRDTRPLIHPRTGRFVGIRQFVPGGTGNDRETDRDVMVPKAVHYAHNAEFSSVYGYADSKACIPFLDGVEKHWDSMIQFGDRLSNPWKLVKYPPGQTKIGDATFDNSDVAAMIGEALEGGSTVRIPSEVYGGNMNPTNTPKWDVTFNQAPASSTNFKEEIELLNAMIRLGISGVPETASGGDAPSEGSNALGYSQIMLMQKNLQAILNALQATINEHVLKPWTANNFGRTCPPVRFQFAPIDFATAQAVLDAMLQTMGTGQPLMDADGNAMYLDYAKVAQNNGFPVRVKKASEMRSDPKQRLADAIRAHMGGGESPEGKGTDPSEDGLGETAPEPPAPKLSEWDETKHPRSADGKFGSGGGASGPIEDHPEFDASDVIDGVKPTSYGVLGPVYASLKGTEQEAVEFLLAAKRGEVPAAFSHPEIGPIDLVYGSDKFGLCKIEGKHSEVVSTLCDTVASLPVVPDRSKGESYWLEDGTHIAIVKQNYVQEPKTWLLTAYELKNPRGGKQ